MFLLIVKDLILIIAILNSSFLQSLIAKKAIEYFANTYNIELSIGNVYLKIPNKIVLSDVEMKDSLGNMLLSADNLNASIEKISITNNFLVLSEINLNEPLINVTIDEKGVANYSYILDKFASNDTTPLDLNLICRKLSITNGRLKYLDKRYDNSSDSFKPSDIEIDDFNVEISRFRYMNDTISVNINDFSLNEKSGIAVNNISGKFKYYDKGIGINDLNIKTNYSELICSEITVKGKDSLYLSNPIEKIEKLTVNIDTIIFSVADLAPFLPQYKGLSDSIHVRGNFSGRLDDFKFKNFGISMYGNTRLYANLSVNGLPDFEQTIVFGNINNMQTNKNDINKILRLVSPSAPIQIPSKLQNLDHIAFNGNLSGMMNDMMAFGQLTTNIGTIKTDIAIMPDWKNHYLGYDGRISATNFNLHEIIPGDNGLGMLSLNVNISGCVDSLSQTHNRLNGTIQRFEFNDYTYSDIMIKGNLSNTAFNGNININDPNLRAELIGSYNFGGHNNKIEVSSDVYANLKELHLAPENAQSSEISFVLGAQLSGDIANRPIGNIILSQAEFNIDDKRLKINKLTAVAKEDNDKKHSVNVESDLLDLEIYGEYKISEVASDIFSMVAQTVPSIFGKTQELKPSANYFTYSFRLKNINDIVKFYDPELKFHGDIYSTNGYVFGNTKTIYGKIRAAARPCRGRGQVTLGGGPQ